MTKAITFYRAAVEPLKPALQGKNNPRFLHLQKDAAGVYNLAITDKVADSSTIKNIRANFESKDKGSLGAMLETSEPRDIVILDYVAAVKIGLNDQITKLSTRTSRFFAFFTRSTELQTAKSQLTDLTAVEAILVARREKLGGAAKCAEALKEDNSKETEKAKNVENKDKLKKLKEERKALEKKKVVVNGKELSRKEKKEQRKAIDGDIKPLLESIRTYEKANDKKAYRKTNAAENSSKKREMKKLEAKQKSLQAKHDAPNVKDKKKARLTKEINDIKKRVGKLISSIARYEIKHPRR